MRPSVSVRTAFVVVEPASSPRNTGPFAVARSPVSAFSFEWRSLNSSSSSCEVKSGSNLWTSCISAPTRFFKLSRNSFIVGNFAPCEEGSEHFTERSAEYAAPLATKSWLLSGTIVCSGVSLSVIAKRSLS